MTLNLSTCCARALLALGLAVAGAQAALAQAPAQASANPATSPTTRASSLGDEALAPPLLPGVTRHVGADGNGSTVVLKPGERFQIDLVGVPTAGYRWTPVAQPELLAPQGTLAGPTEAVQRRPGFAGGSHWAVFAYEARSEGEGVLVLEYRGPSMAMVTASDTFRVRVIVRR